MKRRKVRSVVNIIVASVLVGLAGMLAQGCNSSKKCGCGHDLNGVYYKHKRNW